MIIKNMQYELTEDLYSYKRDPGGKPVLIAPRGSIVTILEDLHFPAIIVQGSKGDPFPIHHSKITPLNESK